VTVKFKTDALRNLTPISLTKN